MAYGLMELAVIGFAGDKLSDRIVAALDTLVNSMTVRILDLTFVKKDENGTAQSLEFDEPIPVETATYSGKAQS